MLWTSKCWHSYKIIICDDKDAVRAKDIFFIIIIKFVFNLNDYELNKYKTLKSNKQRLIYEPCLIYHSYKIV